MTITHDMKTNSLFTFSGLFLFCHLTLMGQYTSGDGDGYQSVHFLGTLNGHEMNHAFGGTSDGFGRSGRSGILANSDASIPYKSGDGDGFASSFFQGTLNGHDLAGMFGGGTSDGFCLASESGPIPDANGMTILNCVQTYSIATGNPLSGTEDRNIIYQAVNLIESNQLVTAGAAVAYRAGQAVHLLDGFQISSGAMLVAYLNGCE